MPLNLKEAEWHSCEEPSRMLRHLRSRHGESDWRTGFVATRYYLGMPRKLRLLVAAATRRLLNVTEAAKWTPLVEFCERFAEMTPNADAEAQAVHELRMQQGFSAHALPFWDVIARPIGQAMGELRSYAGNRAVIGILGSDQKQAAMLAAIHRESQGQCDLIRCLFGNPFAPVPLDKRWLTSDVLALARGAYDERVMPDGVLDSFRLSLLADAIEEVGGENDMLLSHLRSHRTHVRGCWALDVLLGMV